MSFKRDGNDADLLGTLRRRRVKELLSEDIPVDEAKLLSNGRFTCTVCSNSPIFDTVNMLSLHRHGKKHFHNLEIYERKKKELKQLLVQRRQEQFLKDGTASTEMTKHHQNRLLTASPYNPRVGKNRNKIGERKPVLDLGESLNSSSSNVLNGDRSVAAVSSTRQLPGSSLYWQKTCEKQLTGPIKHDRQLKNIFGGKNNHCVRVAPYQSRRCETQPAVSNVDNSASSSCIRDTSTADVHSRGPAGIKMNVKASQCSNTWTGVNVVSKVPLVLPGALPEHQNACYRQRLHTKSPPPPSPQMPHSLPVSSSSSSASNIMRTSLLLQGTSDSPDISCQSTSTFVSTSQQKDPVVEKLKQLQGSGWKRDWDGKWIKDENAEFDSDEEAPDIPFPVYN